MMKRYAVFFIAVVFVIGCAGAAPKEKPQTTESPLLPPASDADTGFPASPAEDVGSPIDKSTGEPPPTGKGKVEQQHTMSKSAKRSFDDGMRSVGSGNLGGAEQAFMDALSKDPRAHQAAYNLGVISERRGDESTAKGYYRQAFSMQADYVDALRAFAKLEIRGGNTDAAVNMLKSKAQTYSQNTAVLNCYSEALVYAGRYTDAEEVAKQALRLDELNAGALLNIGRANFKMGRIELAESVLDRVEELDPSEAEVHFIRAQIRMDDGLKAVAIVQYGKAIEKKPVYVEAMNNLAVLYILSGNYTSATEVLSAAAKISPSWAMIHLNYGNALRGAGKWQQAKDELNLARKLDNKLSSVLYNLAVLYYVADEIDGLDRLARLNKSKRLFSDYKAEIGPRLSKNDGVHKYFKDVEKAIEREERNIERAKRRAERAKEREAEAAAEAAEAKEDDAADDTDSSKDSE